MYSLQPPQKSNKIINILIVAGAVLLLIVGTITAVAIFALGRIEALTPQSSHSVVYQILFDNGISNPDMTPCANFNVVYTLPNGTAQKEVEACFGKFNEVATTSAKTGDLIQFSIQNTWPNNNYARFSCVIKVDGLQVAEVQSIGAYNVASCGGTIP